MALEPGSRLGSYEVLALLGKGGMGEVYRAKDARLGRDVTIKVLPEDVVRDRERLARFKREAKLLASLNHTNIASIFGLAKAWASEAMDGSSPSATQSQSPTLAHTGTGPG